MQNLEIIFMRYLDGECSAIEARAIERILAGEPEKAAAFQAEHKFHQILDSSLCQTRQTHVTEMKIASIIDMLPATTPAPHRHIRTSIFGVWLLCLGMILTTGWIKFNNSSESITTLLAVTCGLVLTAALAWYLGRPRRSLSFLQTFDPRIDLSKWQQRGLRVSAVLLIAISAWIWS